MSQNPSGDASSRSPTAPATRPGTPARVRAGLVLLFVVALALRLWPINHGDGANYLADTHVVRSALGMAKDKDLVPPVGKYSTYPNLLPYTLLPIYGAQYAWGRASGAWSGPGEYGHALLERPALAHIPARILVAVMGALTALVVWRLARDAGLGPGAWVAGWLIAVGLLHLHFSVQERPWAPLVFFLVWSALHAGRAATTGSGRQLALSALAAGLAFATHQGGLVALGLPAIAWVLGPWGPGRAGLGPRVASGVRAVLVFAVVALALGHPYLLVHGATSTAQVAAGEALENLGGTTISVGGQAVRFAFSTDTLKRLSTALVGYDPVLVLLGVPGLFWALRRRALLPGMLFALGWGGFFLLHYNDHVRYLLPLVVFLAIAAGAAAERLWTSPAARAVLLVLLAFPLVQVVRLGHVLRQEDTRTLVLQQLAEHPPTGAIAIDVFGPEVPLNPTALGRLAGLRDLGARERHRLLYYDGGVEPPGPRGIDALPVDAILEFEIRRRSSWVAPRHRDMLLGYGPEPTDWLVALGVREVLLVDRFPADGIPSPLIDPGPSEGSRPKLPPLRVGSPPSFAIDPSRGAPARGARLPTEVDFALLDLWQVTRPGPRIERRALVP